MLLGLCNITLFLHGFGPQGPPFWKERWGHGTRITAEVTGSDLNQRKDGVACSVPVCAHV